MMEKNLNWKFFFNFSFYICIFLSKRINHYAPADQYATDFQT